MACIVGMTTDLERRKKEHKSEHPTLKESSWEEFGPYSSREEAQAEETRLAKKHNCQAHPGGDNPDDRGKKWYVYYFEY